MPYVRLAGSLIAWFEASLAMCENGPECCVAIDRTARAQRFEWSMGLRKCRRELRAFDREEGAG